MAGGALGSLIGVFLTFQFQKKLLKQQLEFQQKLLNQQLAAEEQSHKEHLDYIAKSANSSVQDHTANRQAIHNASQEIVKALDKLT